MPPAQSISTNTLTNNFTQGMPHADAQKVLWTDASLYWSFRGKQLHYKWVNGVLIPQIEMGINPGLPGYQPFK